MATAKSKPSRKSKAAKPRSTPRAATTPPKRPSSATKPQAAQRAGTKHEKILQLLAAPAGTTIAAMMKATGWQQHSVRGFLAAVVRKRLMLDLTSTPNDGGRIYRINQTANSAGKSRAAKSTA